MKLQLNAAQTADFATKAGEYTSLKGACEAVLEAFREADHDPFVRKDIEAVVMAMGCPVPQVFEVKDPETGKIGWQTFYPLIEGWPRRTRTHYGFPENGPGRYPVKGGGEAPPVAPVAAPVVEVAPEPAPVIETPTVAPEAPVVVAPVPVVITGVAWTPSTPTPTNEGYYSDDMGLRRIAVSQTNCFGNYSERAKTTCGTCPLAGFCAAASVAPLGDIAAELDRETEAEIAKVAEPAPFQAVVTEEIHEEIQKTTSAPPVPAGLKEVESPFDGICFKCSGVISEGSIGVHVPGKGLVHPDCARQL